MDNAGEVTRLLGAFRNGDRAAFDRILTLVYDDLRRLARARLRQWPPGETLNTTGLAHEAWIRLAKKTRADWRDRDHFFCVCAVAMRHIMVSSARRRTAAKRGGGGRPVTLDEERAAGLDEYEQVIALDRALDRLAQHNQQLARVVECRHFAGLTGEETARALQLSARTVERYWVRARAWLREDLSGAPPRGGDDDN